jgi:hypothetical protein
MGQKAKLTVLAAILLVALPRGRDAKLAAAARTDLAVLGAGARPGELSPAWSASVRRWTEEILAEARKSGLDPDFIAAVVQEESNGDPFAVSRVGAVGLMGVMPAGPGLEGRPTSEKLLDPALNLDWGVAILASVIRQSGGDIYAALAAYSGGWHQTELRVPQEYARRVLHVYGRAVAARVNVSPNIASRWTIATEIRYGNVPMEPLIMNDPPLSGLRLYGEHVVYHSAGKGDYDLSVVGYAVPLALVVPLEGDSDVAAGQQVDMRLLVRLGETDAKLSRSNPRILLACLPSLARLRGQLATRWFAPSSCPAWHR